MRRDCENVSGRTTRGTHKKLKAVARAIYEKQASEAELAIVGLSLDDLDGGCVDVWPENVPALNLLIAMSTQWRSGMNGPTGLDYAALPAVLRMQGIARADWPDLFDCLRVMESEAMKVMGERSG